MAEQSGIAWTKSTFNPWVGCSKIGPGCDNCYADAMDARLVFRGERHWGAGVPRMRTSDANWHAVRVWNKLAPDTEFAGRKGFWPVFCASLADVFDNEVDQKWREDLFNLIKETPNLTWLLLTKRVGNVLNLVDRNIFEALPNVWLGATVVNQKEADRDIPKLLQIPAKVRFLSIEPMLGPIDLCHLPSISGIGRHLNSLFESFGSDIPIKIDWVIVGGESGHNARPMHPDWARDVRDQCSDAGVQFFFKQWGEYGPTDFEASKHKGIAACEMGDGIADTEFYQGMRRVIWPLKMVGNKAAGNLLDGLKHEEFPEIAP